MKKQSKTNQRTGSVIAQKQANKKNKSKNNDEKIVYRHTWLHNFIYRTQKFKVNGPESSSFHRRTYEVPIQSLKILNRENLGFTNQILCQKEYDSVHLFIPVSMTMKLKNIQQICLDQLQAKIGCVLIISIHIDGLKQPEIIQHLSTKIIVQINRGESFLLRETYEAGKITFKKKKNFLIFTVRDTFPVQIVDDVFLSPFEILNLIFSVTLNSTKVKVQKKTDAIFIEQQAMNTLKSAFETNKIQYNISFNSMRHPLEVPIAYATECRLGVYDLAEQLLEIYSTNKATYQEIIYNFQNFIATEEQKVKKPTGRQAIQSSKACEKGQKEELKKIQSKVNYNFFPPSSRSQQQLSLVLEAKKQKKQKKIKYFQYTHFIVSLYKIPNNSFSTIFIPMFMLALLSIFIFLQREGTFEEQLGSIATFVLGFIALIPSIKDQLPPSQRVSLSQIIVYIESLNCMLSLLDKYMAMGVKRKGSILKNKLFIISMTIHLVCFGITITLLLLHCFVWQKRYKLNKEPILSSPQEHLKAWSNPYCDEQFLKYNQSMKKEKKFDKLIVPWPLENLQTETKKYFQQQQRRLT